MTYFIKSFKQLLILILVFNLIGCGQKKEIEKVKQSTVKVVTSKLIPKLFQEKVRVLGNVEPKEYAMICARVGGVLDSIDIKEGDKVKKRQLLFQTDKINLENLLEISKENLNVVQASINEANANLAKNTAAYEKAVLDYERYKRLFKIDKAITKDAFERVESTWKQLKAGIKHANALVELTKAQARQAESSLKIAKKQLRDSQIKAPFDGVITHKYMENNEFAKLGQAVIRIENANNLELSMLLSSEYYEQVIENQTIVNIYSLKGKLLEKSKITYRSPFIEKTNRTFQIKVDLNSKDTFISGMLCSVEIVLTESKGFGIRKDAVLRRSQGESFIFIVKDEKAQLIEVKTGIIDNDLIELKNVNDLLNVQIVIQGQAFLNDGTPIQNLINDK